jgi:hypothetical protein
MEQLGHLFFSFDVLVEVQQLLSQLDHHVNLADEDLVKLFDISFDIAAWLIDLF